MEEKSIDIDNKIAAVANKLTILNDLKRSGSTEKKLMNLMETYSDYSDRSDLSDPSDRSDSIDSETRDAIIEIRRIKTDKFYLKEKIDKINKKKQNISIKISICDKNLKQCEKTIKFIKDKISVSEEKIKFIDQIVDLNKDLQKCDECKNELCEVIKKLEQKILLYDKRITKTLEKMSTLDLEADALKQKLYSNSHVSLVDDLPGSLHIVESLHAKYSLE